jgi:hypothetical protein
LDPDRTRRPQGTYGIFSSNWSGGSWKQTYASNFNDSGYYIGACPHGAISPITHTHSCWVFMDNYVHDNNNPNVPSAGSAAAGPVGTGMSISGGHNDTVMHNRFVNNHAWGVILVPYADSGGPCTGGTRGALGPGSCLFDGWGNAVLNNTFSHNGSFGHPSNGDIGQLNLEGGNPTSCVRGNRHPGGQPAVTSPSDLQRTHPHCNGAPAAANPNLTFLAEVLCDSQISIVPDQPPACPTGQYPCRTHVTMHALPRDAHRARGGNMADRLRVRGALPGLQSRRQC